MSEDKVLAANWALDVLLDGREETFTLSFGKPVDETTAFITLANYLGEILKGVHTLSPQEATPTSLPVKG